MLNNPCHLFRLERHMFKPLFATPICPFRNNWNDSFFDAKLGNMFLDRVMFCNPIGECYPFHANVTQLRKSAVLSICSSNRPFYLIKQILIFPCPETLISPQTHTNFPGASIFSSNRY